MFSGFFKKQTYSKFDYKPRHYKPELDEKEKKKRRFNIKIQRERRVQRSSGIFKYVIILIIVGYIFLKLQGVI
jgi:hypothetical protein